MEELHAAHVQQVTLILHARLVFQVIMEVVAQPVWLAQQLEMDIVLLVTQSVIARLVKQVMEDPYAMAA